MFVSVVARWKNVVLLLLVGCGGADAASLGDVDRGGGSRGCAERVMVVVVVPRWEVMLLGGGGRVSKAGCSAGGGGRGGGVGGSIDAMVEAKVGGSGGGCGGGGGGGSGGGQGGELVCWFVVVVMGVGDL